MDVNRRSFLTLVGAGSLALAAAGTSVAVATAEPLSAVDPAFDEPGHITTLVGDQGTGRTSLLVATVVSAVHRGFHVYVIDGETGIDEWLRRLRAEGADPSGVTFVATRRFLEDAYRDAYIAALHALHRKTFPGIDQALGVKPRPTLIAMNLAGLEAFIKQHPGNEIGSQATVHAHQLPLLSTLLRKTGTLLVVDSGGPRPLPKPLLFASRTILRTERVPDLPPATIHFTVAKSRNLCPGSWFRTRIPGVV